MAHLIPARQHTIKPGGLEAYGNRGAEVLNMLFGADLAAESRNIPLAESRRRKAGQILNRIKEAALKKYHPEEIRGFSKIDHTTNVSFFWKRQQNYERFCVYIGVESSMSYDTALSIVKGCNEMFDNGATESQIRDYVLTRRSELQNSVS